jgi:hypothetical protein
VVEQHLGGGALVPRPADAAFRNRLPLPSGVQSMTSMGCFITSQRFSWSS